MSAPMSDLAGRVFGNQFRLESLLGRGGMGDIYLAEQLDLGRRVVIKLLTAQYWANHEPEERFRREARVLAQLNHPNIVQLYTYGRTDEGVAYLAMEYIDGRTLSTVLTEHGAMTEKQVLNVLEQLCSALVLAHERGIVHRDLKPDNVMLVQRRGHAPLVKVLDFGIAKLMHPAEPKLTKRGSILGTPQYMAPEQLREHGVDGRTDIYAVGLIGYELATGTVPFDADNTMELMMRVLSDEPVPPTRQAHGVQLSAAVEAIILKCLAKEPADRFQSAAELHEALLAIPRESEATSARPTPTLEPQRPTLSLDVPDLEPRASGIPSRAGRSVAAGLVVLSLFAGVAGVVVWAGLPDPEETAAMSGDGPLLLREWVQGIPFPVGTEYETFDAKRVDARVPADPERVLAFYRLHLAEKWGALREVPSGLTPEDKAAPIEVVSVTASGLGARVLITRR